MRKSFQFGPILAAALFWAPFAVAQQSVCGPLSLDAGSAPTLAEVDPASLINANGSGRLGPANEYDHFRTRIAPHLLEWARDPRLGVNPAYLTALIAKESGFESAAVSWMPAYGYAQLTHLADADMREIAASAPGWNWVASEVESWPRHPAIHSPDATREKTLALLEAGTVSSESEYLFDPHMASRAGTIWIRMLAEIWTSEQYPGRYASFARDRLAAGKPLSDDQLLDLVTASYNQGYVYVRDLVERWGADWKDHLNEEAADHLERIRAYTCLFGGG